VSTTKDPASASLGFFLGCDLVAKEEPPMKASKQRCAGGGAIGRKREGRSLVLLCHGIKWGEAERRQAWQRGGVDRVMRVKRRVEWD